MLNPTVDAAALAHEFRSRGRIQIRDILVEEVARGLAGHLAREQRWHLTTRVDGQDRTIPLAEFAGWPTERKRALFDRVHAAARGEFQYLYLSYMMIRAYTESWDPGSPLHTLVEVLNGPVFLDLGRALTGRRDIARADGQATWYQPGHFLRMHNDDVRTEGRIAAYVLNLTPEWQADWGGLLCFPNEHGEVEECLFPHFNSLSVFTVPMHHFVSQVAAYAGAPRWAITGWFRLPRGNGID